MFYDSFGFVIKIFVIEVDISSSETQNQDGLGGRRWHHHWRHHHKNPRLQSELRCSVKQLHKEKSGSKDLKHGTLIKSASLGEKHPRVSR